MLSAITLLLLDVTLTFFVQVSFEVSPGIVPSFSLVCFSGCNFREGGFSTESSGMASLWFTWVWFMVSGGLSSLRI